VGHLELGDAAVTLTISVPPAAGPETAIEARLEGVRGDSQQMSVEAWTIEGDALSFRLIGFDRPYRFEGQIAGSRIHGTLERQPPPVPSTDLYLIPVETGSGEWRLGTAIPMTDRDGYDNQPFFLPDGQAVLYTSIRDGQADIYRFDLGDRSNRRLTTSPESEYSPTPLPDGSGFSTIRVEADGTQRLWAFDSDGRQPRLLLESVAPVGYQTWLDSGTLALFVLGEPATLQIADLESGTATVHDEEIGRSLHRAPGDHAVTYVAKGGEEGWRIRQMALEDGARQDLISTLPDKEDFLWTPTGQLLMGSESKLYLATPGAGQWSEAADLSAQRIRDISRLAISPDGRWLVVVGARPDLSTFPQRLPLELLRRP